jgi:hypothetical protein
MITSTAGAEFTTETTIIVALKGATTRKRRSFGSPKWSFCGATTELGAALIRGCDGPSFRTRAG